MQEKRLTFWSCNSVHSPSSWIYLRGWNESRKCTIANRQALLSKKVDQNWESTDSSWLVGGWKSMHCALLSQVYRVERFLFWLYGPEHCALYCIWKYFSPVQCYGQRKIATNGHPSDVEGPRNSINVHHFPWFSQRRTSFFCPLLYTRQHRVFTPMIPSRVHPTNGTR